MAKDAAHRPTLAEIRAQLRASAMQASTIPAAAYQRPRTRTAGTATTIAPTP